ncbi:hypothetical protein Pelo_16626 [Pelomyxa schiedti]|nr:hypothetical protein Pelo_16626 [Pelomyxa schiedti]
MAGFRTPNQLDTVSLKFLDSKQNLELQVTTKNGLKKIRTLNLVHCDPLECKHDDDYLAVLSFRPQVLLDCLQRFDKRVEEAILVTAVDSLGVRSYLGDMAIEKVQNLIAYDQTLDYLQNQIQASFRDSTCGPISAIVSVKDLRSVLLFCDSIQVQVSLGISCTGQAQQPIVISAKQAAFEANFVIATIINEPSSTTTSSQASIHSETKDSTAYSMKQSPSQGSMFNNAQQLSADTGSYVAPSRSVTSSPSGDAAMQDDIQADMQAEPPAPKRYRGDLSPPTHYDAPVSPPHTPMRATTQYSDTPSSAHLPSRVVKKSPTQNHPTPTHPPSVPPPVHRPVEFKHAAHNQNACPHQCTSPHTHACHSPGPHHSPCGGPCVHFKPSPADNVCPHHHHMVHTHDNTDHTATAVDYKDNGNDYDDDDQAPIPNSAMRPEVQRALAAHAANDDDTVPPSDAADDEEEIPPSFPIDNQPSPTTLF